VRNPSIIIHHFVRHVVMLYLIRFHEKLLIRSLVLTGTTMVIVS